MSGTSIRNTFADSTAWRVLERANGVISLKTILMLVVCRKPLGLTVCLLCMSFAGLSRVAVSQDVATAVDSAAVLDKCLAMPPSDDGRTQDGFIVLPIHFLFVDGQTRPVADVLCIVSASSDTQEFDWFRIDRTTHQVTKTRTSGEVDHLVPSPNGKYLAVKESPEGAQGIDIVDLPELLRHSTYKSIDGLGSFPGSVSIEQWKGKELYVKSDMLLSSGGNRPTELMSANEGVFSWNVETGVVVAESASLQNPVPYYCGKISNLEDKYREFAILALGRLKNLSAISCLESAIGKEPDESVRAAIKDALQQLTQAAALQRDCLSQVAGTPNGNGIVVEPVHTLFSTGASIPVDIVLCVANRANGDGIWFRFDRTKPDLAGELLKEDEEKVERVRASPDGKYLAVQHELVDIVDLPLLLTAGRYKSVRRMFGSFKEWNGSVLEVESDILQSHAPVDIGDASYPLPLLAKESFLWSGEADTITPAWKALEHPVRYYCEGLASAEVEKRRIAAEGLRLLKDKDSLSCIEQAFRSESDEALQRKLREALWSLTKP